MFDVCVSNVLHSQFFLFIFWLMNSFLLLIFVLLFRRLVQIPLFFSFMFFRAFYCQSSKTSYLKMLSVCLFHRIFVCWLGNRIYTSRFNSQFLVIVIFRSFVLHKADAEYVYQQLCCHFSSVFLMQIAFLWICFCAILGLSSNTQNNFVFRFQIHLRPEKNSA